MTKKVKLILVKPTVSIGDLSVEIEASDLGIASAHTVIPPIQFNLLSDDLMKRFQELKQNVFNDIAETAVTIRWREGIAMYFEDDMNFSGFPKIRDEITDVRLNDYLYLMSEEEVVDFSKRFIQYQQLFDELLNDTIFSYDDMINDSFFKIISDFPSVKNIEKDLRRGILEKRDLKNESEISYGLIDIWLNESEDIIKKCVKEVIDTANIMVVNIPKYRTNNNVLGGFFASTELIEKAISRIEKYNVLKDSKITEIIKNLKTLHSIHKNNKEQTSFDEEDKLLSRISDIADEMFFKK